ncbi:MAG: hypothetical protein J6J60_02505 [Clostridia bacterium]|nr:hypothetical protein [Clostridia bacterium]
MIYITGFVDVRKQIFYKNQTPSHDKNARRIIDLKNWTQDFFSDPDSYMSPSDFLIFRKGFAQIGSSGQKIIIVCNTLYQSDTNNSTVWKAIIKSLTHEEMENVMNYKILKINK